MGLEESRVQGTGQVKVALSSSGSPRKGEGVLAAVAGNQHSL